MGTSENPVSCDGIAGKAAALSRFPRCGICERMVFGGSQINEMSMNEISTPVVELTKTEALHDGDSML